MQSSLHEPEFSDAFRLVGVSHNTLEVEQRERLARLAPDVPKFLKNVVTDLKLREAALVSTCNRFELLVVGAESSNQLMEYLDSLLEVNLPAECFYNLESTEAVRHVFRVAASLDSMVLGEAQILGQVKDAYQLSVQSGVAGKFLHQVFQFAFRLAKKIRTNTSIAERGISVSYVAVKLAQQIFGSLSNSQVLIIGSGRMAELAGLHLKRYGCGQLTVANRTLSRAVELAERIGGRAIGLAEVESFLPSCDVVISSIQVDKPVIESNQVRKRASHRPLFLIDLGVPRNFPSALGELEDVYLYNLDDLSEVVDENSELREEAAKDAEIIIEYGIFQFQRWLTKLSAEPAIVDFRSKVREVCASEVRKILREKLSDSELVKIEDELAYSISQKIAHDVTGTLAGSPDGKLDAVSLLPFVFDEILEF